MAALKRVGFAALAGAGAATLLAGGVYASGVLQVVDNSSMAVGGAQASTGCAGRVSVKAGHADFNDSVGDFAYSTVTVQAVPEACMGLDVTVVGVSGSGARVAQAAGSASSGDVTLNLDSPVSVGEVASWKVIIQN